MPCLWCHEVLWCHVIGAVRVLWGILKYKMQHCGTYDCIKLCFCNTAKPNIRSPGLGTV